MAQLLLVHGNDPRLLLEAAASGFLVPNRGTVEAPFPSPAYLLVLRQGGVRDDLLALAAGRGVPGWFDPPLAVFDELPPWLGETGRTPLSEAERVLVLTRVLREAGTQLFARAGRLSDFVDAVDRHFGELIAEGVPAADYRAALESVGRGEEFERRRDGDLAECYARYVDLLAETNRRDGRENLLDGAMALALDPTAFADRLGQRREIRIFGLSDLRGGWRPLLRALSDSPVLDRIVVYASERLDLQGLVHATELLAGTPTLGPALAERLFTPEPGAQRIDLIEAPDPEREVEEVARRVRTLGEQGVPLDQIAVIARSARPYLDLVASRLERMGVPVAIRQRVAHVEIPIVRALLTLFAAAAERWSRHGLTELAEQPYLSNGLDAGVIGFLGFRERLLGLPAWQAAFTQLLAEAQAAEDPEEGDQRPRGLPAAERVAAARAGFESFTERARILDEARPLSAWLDWLLEFLERDPWALGDSIYTPPPEAVEDRLRLRIVRRDLTGWRGMTAIVREWREAVTRWREGNEILTVEQFEARLREMLNGDAVFWSETQRGVRVLEGLAAAYRSFPHVFLVGLSGDHLPKRAPASPLFTEEERAELAGVGLPLDLKSVWDQRERALFRQLVAAASVSLTASFPALDEGGRETVPSAFLEELSRVARPVAETIPAFRVVIPGVPLISDWVAAEQARHAATIERRRETGILGPWSGGIEDPALVRWLETHRGDDYRWSPTQLESYAKCPWAYFSGRLLGLQKLEDPDEDMDRATRGALLHEALQRFFTAARERQSGPVVLRASDLAWATSAMDAALDQTLRSQSATVWLGHPALRPARRAEMLGTLLEYLRWEAGENEATFDPKSRKRAAERVRTAVELHEVEIADVVLERNGVTLRYRGRIDRVEVGADDRVEGSQHLVAAVDYKSSKGSTPGGGQPKAWDDGVVLQIPLYAHALTQLRPGSEVARVEYRALRKPGAVHNLELVRVDRNARALRGQHDAAEKMAAALDRAVEHVKAVRRGEFPVNPPPTCNCPDWCHGFEICRVPGGPRRNPW